MCGTDTCGLEKEKSSAVNVYMYCKTCIGIKVV